MPLGLERWHGGHDLHFITFSCYDRQPLLATAQRRDLFLEVLERVRRRYRWAVLAYVVMPEHVHLLVGWPGSRDFETRGIVVEPTQISKSARSGAPALARRGA